MNQYLLQKKYPQRLHLVFHVVSSEEHFPINKLRNIGISHVSTSHYVVIDMDLWPSRNLYTELFRVPPSILMDQYAAVILPVFFLNRKILPANASFSDSVLLFVFCSCVFVVEVSFFQLQKKN